MSYSEHQQSAAQITARCAIVTLSDTRTPDTDTTGQLLRTLLTTSNHTIHSYHLCKDDPAQLTAILTPLLADPALDLILTNGGTGISPRDQTIPTIERLIESPLPGFGELFRMLSYQQIGSGALLSRATAGIVNNKLLFSLPGSPKAAELALTKLILPELKHLLHELRK
ncbi:MAG TPA: MogA/MoaB family molybdenum cofactor biosynthesis protein [Tepidisphaeraceae bacterium]|jgi:molybdenum cofactor biosynthesis protein B|nr:MogA/MoaB family molybdenum cofactor biosynthesis protein [Tepidisphaeraceae bacterium]